MQKSKEVKYKNCLGCLSKKSEKVLQRYEFKCEMLKSLLQIEYLYLCSKCRRSAQNAEKFIQDIQRNQTQFNNMNSLTDANTEISKNNRVSTDSKDIKNEREKIELDIKTEIKMEEKCLNMDFIDTNLNMYENNETTDDALNISENIDEDNFDCQDRTLGNSELIKVESDTVLSENKTAGKKNYTKVIHITREQFLAEREGMRKDEKYLTAAYKCEDCIKWFIFKDVYDKHMLSHSKTMGEFQCNICKQRMINMKKLKTHEIHHKRRFKCIKCSFTRVTCLAVQNHYTKVHLQNDYQHKCTQCSKIFKNKFSYKRHIEFVHTKRKHVKCKYCDKMFVNEYCMKVHMIGQHATEISKEEIGFKVYSCKYCNTKLWSQSLLDRHMLVHTNRREHYCVECDKSFKSPGALKRHLKVSSAHVAYADMPLQCDDCGKRFSAKTNLGKHMNRVHLNNKPFRCNLCDKAFINVTLLKEHKKYRHEGLKRPLKYSCPICEWKFDQSTTLKRHMRVHTGERPYSCTQCAARFSQNNILRRHVAHTHSADHSDAGRRNKKNK